jgi:hypothetical protein
MSGWCCRAILAGVLFVVAPSLVHAAGDTRPQHYSRSELRQLIHNAKSADQYDQLARYFHSEEANFRHQAEEENRVYERYRTNTRPKTPTAADNARSSRDYYSVKAHHAATLAAKYDALRASASGAPPATATTPVPAAEPAAKH